MVGPTFFRGPGSALRSAFKYTQGQTRGPKSTREYFYFVDHQGMLFLDDSRMKNFTSAFKDVAFLTFFFRRLRRNDDDYQEHFAYVSLCGPERNYVRSDDTPLVFTKLSPDNQLHLNHTQKLLEPFRPSKLIVKESGRVYHPLTKHPAGDQALVRSALVQDFKLFYDNEQTDKALGIIWEGEKVHFENST